MLPQHTQAQVDRTIAEIEALARMLSRLEIQLKRVLNPNLRPRRWTPTERQVLRQRFPNEPAKVTAKVLKRQISSIYQEAYKLGLKKSAAFLASPASGRTNGRQGFGSRFEKGHKTWNKGVKVGTYSEAQARTQFKKGAKPLNTWKPIGTETVTKDGYLVRKVTDVGGYNNDDWKFVHHLVWEKAHGPVPKGRIVIFKNGDKRDFALGNLECLTHAENMRRNSVQNLPPDLRRLVQLSGVLKRAINKRKNHENN